MIIPFHKPIIPDTLDEIFLESLKGGWLTTGPAVEDFECTLRDYLNANYTIAVNSGTAALHLALAARDYKKGDKFIAPTYTFVSTVEVGEYLGMTPVLIDCDSNYNIDINQIEDKIKKDSNIKCIIPVHFAGKPVDMKSISYLVDKFNLFVIEDAAHALEAESNVGKVGDTKHAAAFSFYANKNITTAGEGGAIATNDKVLAEKIKKLSLHGMSKDGWKRFKMGSKWHYDISHLGYKYNMTDVAASFGNWQMRYINEWHSKRSSILKTYINNLSAIEGVVFQDLNKDKEKHAYHLFVIRLIPKKWKIKRNKMIALLNKGGIGTSMHYTPIHMHSYYQKKYGYAPGDFPNAKKYSENAISLPLYPSLKDEEVRYIIKFVKKLWEEYKS